MRYTTRTLLTRFRDAGSLTIQLSTSLQTAAFNLGVNNRVSTLRLNEVTGRLESPGGRAIAIVHQYDRRAAVKAFFRRHRVEV